jgi:small subunit ribosomal protein S6
MDITPKSFNNEYETTFILIPELSGDDQKQAVDKIVQLIKENGGTIHSMEHWGVRKLTYPIARKTSGFYAYIEFNSPSELIPKLEQAYRYDDQVLRYLTVKLDKHALAFNKKRRDQGFGLRKEAKKF